MNQFEVTLSLLWVYEHYFGSLWGNFNITWRSFGFTLGIKEWLWVALGQLGNHFELTLGTLWEHFGRMRVPLDHFYKENVHVSLRFAIFRLYPP